MATVPELRAEAERLREFAPDVTDNDVLDELQVMILELERRARALENSNENGG